VLVVSDTSRSQGSRNFLTRPGGDTHIDSAAFLKFKGKVSPVVLLGFSFSRIRSLPT
jgi:hypothetical protein